MKTHLWYCEIPWNIVKTTLHLETTSNAIVLVPLRRLNGVSKISSNFQKCIYKCWIDVNCLWTPAATLHFWVEIIKLNSILSKLSDHVFEFFPFSWHCHWEPNSVNHPRSSWFYSIHRKMATRVQLPQKTSDFGIDSISIFSCVWRVVVIIVFSKYFCYAWTHLMCVSCHFGSVNWQPDVLGWLVDRFLLQISWLAPGTIQMPFLGSVRIIMINWLMIIYLNIIE